MEAIVDVSGLIKFAVDSVLFPLELPNNLMERAEALHLVLVLPAAPFSRKSIAFIDNLFSRGTNTRIGMAQKCLKVSAFSAEYAAIEIDTVLHVSQCLTDLQFLRAEFEAFATQVSAVSLP